MGGHCTQALRSDEQGAWQAGGAEGWGRGNITLGGGKRSGGRKTQTCSRRVKAGAGQERPGWRIKTRKSDGGPILKSFVWMEFKEPT